MRIGDVRELVESTRDSAFAVDGSGMIVAWNSAAEEMFGLASKEAIGKPCSQIVQGMDECGTVCSQDCTVQQAVRSRRPVRNFDLQVQTRQGMQWCNISVLMAEEARSSPPYSIHIVRPIDLSKKLELLVRDFVVTETKLPQEQAKAIVASTRAAAREADLTNAELKILRLLAKGASTANIAALLHISRATVNNHVQHILRKLNAHTRLEVIRRAEHAGLV